MKAIAVLAMCWMSCAGFAQETPVSEAESDIAIRKAYGYLREVLHLPQPKFVPSTAKTPLTREQLIGRLAAMHQYVAPKIQPKFRPAPTEIKNLATGLSEARRRDLKNLAASGLVSADSLLIKSSQNQYAPRELGAILGVFLARVMDITHELDPKYSPELMPD